MNNKAEQIKRLGHIKALSAAVSQLALLTQSEVGEILGLLEGNIVSEEESGDIAYFISNNSLRDY